MDEQQEQLFGLMAVAQEQQKAIEAAVDALAAEQAKLAHERIMDRAALAHAVTSVDAAVVEVRAAAAAVVPAAQRAAGDAVGAAVRKSLDGAAEAAAEALEKATRPVIDSLSGVVQAAGKAEGSMRRAGAWFAWKWIAVAAGGVAGVCLVAYASLAWQLHQVERLTEQKAALAVEVARLQAGVAALEKQGGRIVMNTCGGRLCIEASSNQGTGAESWKGAHWSNKENGVSFVIPKGY